MAPLETAVDETGSPQMRLRVPDDRRSRTRVGAANLLVVPRLALVRRRNGASGDQRLSRQTSTGSVPSR